MKNYALIIVGAGPAGSAAAIHLAHRAPALAARSLLLEKAHFPRFKLCGGGVTQHALDLLRLLRVELTIPSYPIHAMHLIYDDLEATFKWRNLFHIVQRDALDMLLAHTAQARGVELREGVRVRDLVCDRKGVTLCTDQGELHAEVVIGADGANSIIRQKLGLRRADRISRVLEVFTPVADAVSTREFAQHTAVFDFTPIAQGVQGYYWDFPSWREGQPVMSRGLFDSRVRPERPRAALKAVFESELKRRGLNLAEIKLYGHPERWFDARAPHAAPRVLLAGDAAGVDPWLGEGISHALDFGMHAAEAAIAAFQRNDFSFADYSRRLAESPLGRRLRLKRMIAYCVYGNRGEWFYRWGWRMLQLVLFPVWRK